MLLDLPPELVRPVFEHVTRLSTLQETLRVRQVCSLFDHEVMAVVEQDRLLGPNMKQPAKKHQPSFMRFLARFLSNRPHARRADVHWSDNASAFLNHILDTCGVASLPDRLAGFETLFGMMNLRVASSPSGQGFSDFVLQNLRSWNDAPLYSPDSRWVNHLLPASIALNAPHVYGPLLPTKEGAAALTDTEYAVQSARLKRPSKVFGTPLAAAVASSLSDVVRQILHFQPDLMRRSPTHLLSVAATAGGEAMIDLLLQYELPRHWSLHTAILRCADEGRVGCARTLLKYILNTVDRPHVDIPWMLQEGLHVASVNRDRDMVRCFLDHGADLNQNMEVDFCRERRLSSNSGSSAASAGNDNPVRPPPITLAAWAGDEEFMNWLAEHGAVMHGTFTDASPIYGAILADDVGMLKKLLKIGVGEGWSQVDWVDALYTCVEIHANGALRHLLLEAKVVDIPSLDAEEDDDMELGGLVEKMCKYGNVGAFDILVDAGMAMEKPFSGLPSWTAMVVAQSYRSAEAGEIVGKLEALGIRRREVSEMPYPERFESGEWPRRGSRSTSCMPESMDLKRRVCRGGQRSASVSS